MSDTIQLVVFRLDDRRFALPLASVEHVVRAVDVTPLPSAPSIVLGAINVAGRVLPVLNLRRRFALPDRALLPEDSFLLARTAHRPVVLPIDEAEGVVQRPSDDIVESSRITPGLEHFPGVVTFDDGLVLIHDLERFLSLDESRALDDAIGGEPEA